MRIIMRIIIIIIVFIYIYICIYTYIYIYIYIYILGRRGVARGERGDEGDGGEKRERDGRRPAAKRDLKKTREERENLTVTPFKRDGMCSQESGSWEPLVWCGLSNHQAATAQMGT